MAGDKGIEVPVPTGELRPSASSAYPVEDQPRGLSSAFLSAVARAQEGLKMAGRSWMRGPKRMFGEPKPPVSEEPGKTTGSEQ